MRVMDYVRLGTAQIFAHKRRALMVIAISGVVFGVLVAGNLLIRGAENAIMSAMLKPTDGKMILGAKATQNCFQEVCEEIDTRRVIEETVQKANGAIVKSGEIRVGYNTLEVLMADIVKDGIVDDWSGMEEGSVPVVISARELAMWMTVSVPAVKTPTEVKIELLEKLREDTLGKTITVGGQKYFIAGIMPGGFGVSDFSLVNVGHKHNPLNLILEGISAGDSKTFALDDGRQDYDLETSDRIWAEFASVDAARSYQQMLSAENCMMKEDGSGFCAPIVEYEVEPAFGDVIGVDEGFRVIWKVYNILAIVMAVIAGMIMVSTYTRLIGYDKKEIALYRTMGASSRQVAGVYIVYLLGLSLLASVFALVLGLVLVVMVNLLNGTALAQIFALTFGGEMQRVMFLGFDAELLGYLGVVLALAPMVAVINFGQYKAKGLAKQIK